MSGSVEHSKSASVINLRDARPADIERIQQIYAYYVENTLITAAETIPTKEKMLQNYEQIRQQNLPYRVIEVEGMVQGFAYVGTYRQRSAFRFTVENSIYLDINCRGRGLGSQLLLDLLILAQASGNIHQIVAVIGGQDNLSSINLHKKLGFELIGVQKEVYFKFKQWMDIVIMQKAVVK